MIDTASKLRFYTVERLGPKMHRTQEGYLVIYDTAIARTGQMIYGPEETPIEAGPDGIVKIDRHPADVFHPDTINSFAGKPLVNEHPESDVNPANWNDLAVGIVMNPRRGEHTEDDLLLADVQVTNADAIADVLAGKRELSCGYDAEYVQTGPGQGYQTKIVGNHVALVAKGRCGSRCRITDSIPQGVTMLKKWLDSLKAAVASKDNKKVEELIAAVPAGTTDDEATGAHIHIHQGSAAAASGDRKWNDEAIEGKFGEHEKAIKDCRDTMDTHHKSVMDSLEEIKKGMPKSEAEDKEVEGQLEEEAPAGTGDKARKATDSVFLADSYQQTIAMAEIISPGLHYNVFDSARDPKKTYRDMCGLRRKALQLGNNDAATNGIIEKIRGGKPLTADSLEKMPCQDVRTLFYTVATIKREKNNAIPARDTPVMVASNGAKKAPTTIAEWNAANLEYYKSH